MWIIITVSSLSLFLTILESKAALKHGMAVGFLLITMIAAFKYNYGNDYINYYYDFKDVARCSYLSLLNADYTTSDVGWALLCKFLQPIGYYNFIAIMAIVMNYIYYKFIKENVAKEDYWLAVFIYLFTFDFFLLQQTMMRQGLVIALFVLSYKYLKNKKIVIPIILVSLSIFIHQTAAILIPFIFLSLYDYSKIGKKTVIILLGILTIFIVSNSLLHNLLGNFMAIDLFSKYDLKYSVEEGNKFGIRKCLEFIPFIVSLRYLIIDKTKNGPRYMVILSTFATLIYPFSLLIQLVSRLSFYFEIFTIATIPITYKSIQSKIIRCSLLTLFILLTIYVYIDRFTDSVYTKSFLEYHTIFER